MKTLWPSGLVRSAGRSRRWTALIAVASLGCLPLFSVLADQNNKNENKNGGNKAPSSHQGSPRTGGVSNAPSVHPGVNHTVNTPRPSNHIVSAPHPVSAPRPSGNRVANSNQHQGGNHIASTQQHTVRNHTVTTAKTANTHQTRNNVGVNKTAASHQGNGSRNVANKTVTSRGTTRSSATTKNERTRLSKSELRNVSPGLRHGASSNTRTSLIQKNSDVNRSTTNTRKFGNRANLQTRINFAAKGTSFNRSMTVSSAHTLMNQRITQITNRQWTTHGTVFSTRSDPQRGFWFQRSGFWWRCNFWGAHAFCNRLVVAGWPAGLCWSWYDDICWGNVVIGMPLELVTYYYPDPVQTEDSTYDGEDATVYYYAMADGQYKQVTVVDGDVVDVEIVDHIS